MKDLIFDIETGPLPEEELRKQIPAFDPDAVKLGNVKDPEKRAQKIAEAKESHYENAYKKAALHAWSGQVLAVGYKLGDEDIEILHGDEEIILDKFSNVVRNVLGEGGRVVGFNSIHFDLPFLARRAMLHGTTFGGIFRPPSKYYPRDYVDLLEIWQCGNRQEFISLNRLAKFLGCDEKDCFVEAAHFWEFYENSETQAMALAYLKQDVEVTAQIAEKILP